MIDSDGWVNNGMIDDYLTMGETEFLGECEYKGDTFFRPISLKGIESNNGWIKIECENDLPKQSNNLWLLANDGSLILGRWCIFSKIFKTSYGDNFDSDGIVFTHYQHVSKPKTPIY